MPEKPSTSYKYESYLSAFMFVWLGMLSGISKTATNKLKRIKAKEMIHFKIKNQRRQINFKDIKETDIYDRAPECKPNNPCFAIAVLALTDLSFFEIEELINKKKVFRKWNREVVWCITCNRVLKELGYVKFKLPQYRSWTVEEAYYTFGGDVFYKVFNHLLGINKDGLLIDTGDSSKDNLLKMYYKPDNKFKKETF